MCAGCDAVIEETDPDAKQVYSMDAAAIAATLTSDKIAARSIPLQTLIINPPV